MFVPSENFLRSRQICPCLPDGVHELACDIAKRTEKIKYISPQELALTLTTILEEKKIADFELFPQLIDKMTQEYIDGDEYATTFRRICLVVLGINPSIIITPKEYPESINTAVEWWAKTVLFRNDLANMPTAFQKALKKEYSTEEIAIFKATLARQIAKKLAHEKEVWLYSGVTTSQILQWAGDKIGIDPILGYPKASMVIYETEVQATVDGGDTWKTIFCNY